MGFLTVSAEYAKTDLQSQYLDLLFTLLIWAIVLYIYFIPTSVAMKRKHLNYLSIFVINLFLGWTIIAWVICLSWAVKVERKSAEDGSPRH